MSDLLQIIDGISFPAWVEASDATCIYHNERILSSILIGSELRGQVSGKMLNGGVCGGVISLTLKHGGSYLVDVAHYPLFANMGDRDEAHGGPVRIFVICDLQDRAERDRDVAYVLWGKLLRGHALEEEARLSPQQRRIYRLIRNDMTYKEIAAELGAAHSTVRVQVAKIRKIIGSNKVPVLRRDSRKPL